MKKSYEPVNISCVSCGAPAKFDVAKQVYVCRYCGAETGISESLREKEGFRRIHRAGMEEEKTSIPMVTCSCTGCGATVVFPENEALSDCAFCGRSLVRREYLDLDGFPEILIPFRITEAEAKQNLLAWCDANPGRPETKAVRSHADQLKGFYLPYELIKGPTDCTVYRSGSGRGYHCRGFLEGSFVNTSSQLNNLLLDGMEPYDLNDLQEFRFSFLAGQRVKIRDVNSEETVVRIKNEIASDYEPFVARVMEDHAVQITPTTDSLMRLSAVLPAYYLRAGKTLAAVNGQTGKVAVREAKDRFLLPWQIRPILWTIAVSLLVYCIAWLFGARQETRLIFAGCMAVFLLITLFAAYDNFYGGEKRFRQLRRIFTSDKTKKTVDAPEFYEVIDGKPVPVELRFTTVPRMARMVLIALAVVFLPLILAFILNGFSARGLTVGGAAVWLCITVPVAPVYFLNFGRLALYEHPLIWIKKEDGTRVRYHENKQTVQDVLNSAKELVNPATLLILAAVIGVLIINVVLVLHWDQF